MKSIYFNCFTSIHNRLWKQCGTDAVLSVYFKTDFFLQKEWIKRENSIMLVPQTRRTLTVPAASLRLNGKDKALPLGCTFHELLPYVFHCCVYISNQTLAFYP